MLGITNRNDVARKAGVSGATVSRVFNDPDCVSAETREKVMNAAHELNYHPNVIASNFVKGISGNIGVVMPYIPNVHIFSVYYFSEILSGIGEALAEYGYDLVLFFNKPDNEGRNDYSRYFKGKKVDGCILLGTHRDDIGLLELRKTRHKFCLINNYIENSSISFVDVDNVYGSYEAVSHLIKLGHRNIAFLNGPSCYSNSIDRRAGYLKALKEHNIPVKDEFFIEGNYGKKSGYNASEKIIKLKNMPTAVFAANDRMAAGLMQGLREKGVRIPQDIAVTGYDDADIATIVEPQLTTVRIPFFELGRRCVDEFIKIINNECREKFDVFIKPELIIRESSGGII